MSSPAKRMREFRRRKKAGLVVCPVVVPEQLVDHLVGCGYLTLDETEDRQAVGEAIVEALEAWLQAESSGGRSYETS